MNTKEYFKQLSIVILGILIAFWINNIGTRHKEHVTQKQVLSVILREVAENNENVKEAIQNLDSLQMACEEIQKVILSSEKSVNVSINYSNLDVKDIGYEIAKYTGVLKDINHELTSEIVENYETQNALEDFARLVRDEIFELFRYQKKDKVDYLLIQIRNMKSNLHNFEEEQEQLIEKLTVFLKIEA